MANDRNQKEDKFVTALMLVFKVLTTFRTAVDTWAVSQANLGVSPLSIPVTVVNIFLMDIFFLAMWLAVTSDSKSKKMSVLRPAAAVFAWVMYAMLTYIGWNAHPGPVSVFSRMAGAGMLLFDTWGYIGQSFIAFKERRKARKAELAQMPIEQRRALRREAMWTRAYKVFSTVAAPMAWWLSIRMVLSDLQRDFKTRAIAHEQAKKSVRRVTKDWGFNEDDQVYCFTCNRPISKTQYGAGKEGQAARAFSRHARGTAHKNKVAGNAHDNTNHTENESALSPVQA